MKKLLILTISVLSLNLFSCKQSSENQGYDSGPTTKSEEGSKASGEGTITTDSTGTASDTSSH